FHQRAGIAPVLAGHRRTGPVPLVPAAVWNEHFPLAGAGSGVALHADGRADWRRRRLSRGMVGPHRAARHRHFSVDSVDISFPDRARAAAAEHLAARIRDSHVSDDGTARLGFIRAVYSFGG